jgi:microcin C transport system substrate-binding protein
MRQPPVYSSRETTSLFGWVFRVVLAAMVLGAYVLAPASAEDAPTWHFGESLVGTVKYQPGFQKFDYVNPDAPKGGTLRLGETGTFDNFNPVVGNSKGNIAPGIGLIYQRLTTQSLDEVSAQYGEIADAWHYPADFSSVTYRIRPEAKWWDGTPITAEDVVWSFEAATANDPQQQFYYSHVKKAEATAEREVTFTFDQAGNRELPFICGEVLVLPKHWWTGKDANGTPRDVSKTTLELPMGSGPYKVKSYEVGRTLTLERVKDFWGEKLPAGVGQNNFDQIRYEFFRDDEVQLQAFKGDNYDIRIEPSAKHWATEYDFPAKAAGRVVLDRFPQPMQGSGVMTGFIPNLRRPLFQDDRVRLALSYLFNFEEINRTIFFGQYEHIDSYFYPTILMSRGLPEGRELEILQEAKAKGGVPDEVFTQPFKNPVGGDTTAFRKNQREALRLLNAAGWVAEGNNLVNAKTKEPFKFEFLINSPADERVLLPYQTALASIGIQMTIRNVDTSQFVNRVRKRDFDMIHTGWAQSLSPGNEQQEYFGSKSADQDGSKNYGGIKNPAIDFIIHEIIYNKGREDLVAATKALDRVLLWNHYVVPGWTLSYERIARWDRFSYPEPLPTYSIGMPTTWWYDVAKAAKTGGKN